jgi:hypothetical protein
MKKFLLFLIVPFIACSFSAHQKGSVGRAPEPQAAEEVEVQAGGDSIETVCGPAVDFNSTLAAMFNARAKLGWNYRRMRAFENSDQVCATVQFNKNTPVIPRIWAGVDKAIFSHTKAGNYSEVFSVRGVPYYIVVEQP